MDQGIQAAREMGLRYHAARGAMSKGQSQVQLSSRWHLELGPAQGADATILVQRPSGDLQADL